MKKILLSVFFLISLSVNSQTTRIYYQDMQHGDTVFRIKTTQTLSLDSVMRYAIDSSQYKYYFYNVTETVKDSTQLNKLTTGQLNNTAGFITPTSLVPYIPKVDTADYIETKHKAKLKTDSLADALLALNAATYLPKTSTSNIGTSPTASSTVTITHNLGRVPTIIRIYGYGTFTSNAAATATTSSMGVWNSSGNRCVYQRYGAAITTTQVGLSSNTFCILLATGGGNFISGVIQNVTASSFDLVFSETGTATAQPYLWEAQEP